MQGDLHALYCRRRAFQSAAETTGKATERTYGDKLAALGLSLRAAALLPRLAPLSQALRFAGAGPMIAGTLVTLYEIGGWRLLLAIPTTTAACLSLEGYVDAQRESDFKADVSGILTETCPSFPKHFFEDLQSASARQYETNHICLEVSAVGEAGDQKWHAIAYGQREHACQKWVITSVSASRGKVDMKEISRGLPPAQTRTWGCSTAPFCWEIVYQTEQT